MVLLDPEKRANQLVLQGLFGVVSLVVYVTLATAAFPRLPLPGEIVTAFLIQIEEEALLAAVWHALYAIFLGFLTAVVVGVPVGLAMGIDESVEQFLDPYLNGLYVLPFAALVPAFIIWFGTGLKVRWVIVFMFAVFPIAINTFEGAKTAPPNLLEVARSFNASRRFLITNVVLPHEMPYILAGLRLGIGRAVKGLVVTEIIVAVSGLGGIIKAWSASYQLEGVFSVVILLMALGMFLPWLLKQVHDRLIWWDVSET